MRYLVVVLLFVVTGRRHGCWDAFYLCFVQTIFHTSIKGNLMMEKHIQTAPEYFFVIGNVLEVNIELISFNDEDGNSRGEHYPASPYIDFQEM